MSFLDAGYSHSRNTFGSDLQDWLTFVDPSKARSMSDLVAVGCVLAWHRQFSF